VPRIDFGSTHLLVVGIEPQVVGTVRSQIVLVTAQIQVPHFDSVCLLKQLIIILISTRKLYNNQHRPHSLMAEISSQATCARQLSTMPEADMIGFVDDTVHFLKGNKVPFLSKYNAAFGGQSRLIVPARDFLQDIMQLVLRKSQAASSVDAFKTVVSDYIFKLTEAET